jgi:hypothetical protein
MYKAAANIGVFGGVERMATSYRCVRLLLTLVCLVV